LASNESSYTLTWQWSPPDAFQSSTIEFKWPEAIPLEKDIKLIYALNDKNDITENIQDGIVSTPVPQSLTPGSIVKVTFSGYYTKNNKHQSFINPGPGDLLFSFRYSKDSPWVTFTPIVIQQENLYISYINWTNRYTSQPVELEVLFGPYEKLDEVFQNGFCLVFSSNIQFPSSILPQTIYVSYAGSQYQMKATIINPNILLLQPESTITMTKTRVFSLTIKSSAQILNPAEPNTTVSCGFTTNQSVSPMENATWSILPWEKPPTLILSGGTAGKDDWFLTPPTLRIQSSDPESRFLLNGYRIEDLNTFSMPLLEGQYKFYCTYRCNYPHRDANQADSRIIQIDTIPVHLFIKSPVLSWSISPQTATKIQGSVVIPDSVIFNETMTIIDQSLRIQNQMAVLLSDGSFSHPISLQPGVQHIPVELSDWSGHQATKTLHIYQGKGVVMQIKSSVAWINDQTVKIDAPPLLRNSRTYVPIRFISEAFGAKVTYQPKTKPPSVLIQRNHQTIELTTGSTKATVNGKSYTLDAPPFIDQNRMMVPIRFLADIWNMQTRWESSDQVVAILFP
jgi:hypothetical protein